MGWIIVLVEFSAICGSIMVRCDGVVSEMRRAKLDRKAVEWRNCPAIRKIAKKSPARLFDDMIYAVRCGHTCLRRLARARIVINRPKQ